MPTVDVLDQKKSIVGKEELPDAVFAARINASLIHDVVRMQRAGMRRGTASTLNRAAMKGGGRKPWRQKGTGRARAGSNCSPLWVGGAVTFGPHPRDFSYTMPKKARRAALKSVLTDKVNSGMLILLKGITLGEPKTKEVADILAALNISSALIVIPERDDILLRCAKNIPRIKVIMAAGINVYDVLAYEHLVMTVEALNKVKEALLK